MFMYSIVLCRAAARALGAREVAYEFEDINEIDDPMSRAYLNALKAEFRACGQKFEYLSTRRWRVEDGKLAFARRFVDLDEATLEDPSLFLRELARDAREWREARAQAEAEAN